MRSRALTATALALTASLPAAPAGAAEPEGILCGWTSLFDPFSDDPNEGWAELEAGPLVLDPDPAGQPVWGSVTCALVKGPTHDTAVYASATSDVTPGVVALPATVVRARFDPFEVPYLCTSVEIAGRGTLYWDPYLGDQGAWTADRTARCAWPLDPPEDPPEDPQVVEDLEEAIDAAVCPVLTMAFPPHGDVDGIWDCPPYDF